MKPASLNPEDAAGTSKYPGPTDYIEYVRFIDYALRKVMLARLFKKTWRTHVAEWILRKELTK